MTLCRSLLASGIVLSLSAYPSTGSSASQKPQARGVREQIFRELQPVALKNCTLKRYGSPNDGGYLMCANLIAGATSVYSYGIASEDMLEGVVVKHRNLKFDPAFDVKATHYSLNQTAAFSSLINGRTTCKRRTPIRFRWRSPRRARKSAAAMIFSW